MKYTLHPLCIVHLGINVRVFYLGSSRGQKAIAGQRAQELASFIQKNF